MRVEKRLKSDSGAAVTILGLALTALILLMACFMIDFVKNGQIKNDYTGAAQRATQAALINQNGVGGLTSIDSANSLIKEYMLETRGYAFNDDKRMINQKQTTDTGAFRNTGCSMDSENSYPIIKIFYDTGRHNASYLKEHQSEFPHFTSVHGARITSNSDETTFDTHKYRTITAFVTDVSDNYFFGMFSKGQACQVYNINVSSMATKSDDFQNAGNE